jgi:hypothetical protein
VTAGGKTQAQRLLERRGMGYQEVVFPETIHDAFGVAAFADLPLSGSTRLSSF